MLHTRVHEGPEWVEELLPHWSELFEHSDLATPFQSPEWVGAWWEVYGSTKQPHVLSVWDGKDLAALWPLYRTRGGWRALRPIGLGSSDYLHPLIRRQSPVDVWGKLREGLESAPVDLIDLHQVRGDFGAEVLPGKKVEQATCLVLDLPSTYDEYLKTLSKSLRYDVRRIERDTADRFRLRSCDETGTDAALDVFFEAHRSRWKKRGLPGAFVGKRSERFHRLWAAKAAPKGMLWLSVLEVDGKPAGAIYAMRAGSSCFFYQSGFDPSVASLSPGTLLVAQTIRRAIEEGLTTFDFLRGDEPYKRRWKPQHERLNYRLISRTEGARGKAAEKWNHWAWRVESRIRKRLEGRGLF